jgi:DNA-binding transcriptional ArsR family regulator
MFVSLKEAGEATGVPYPIIAMMITSGRIASRIADNKVRSMLVREADFGRIQTLYHDTPAEGDPTPEEITERCEAVLQLRETTIDGRSAAGEVDRKRILTLLRKQSGLSAAEVAAELDLSFHAAKWHLTKLEESGSIECVTSSSLKRYAISGDDIDELGMPTADAILADIQARAQRRAANRLQSVRSQPQAA